MPKDHSAIGVGIIGCGKISQAYFDGARHFDLLDIRACADLNPDIAKAKAAANHCRALSIEALLADPDIEIVINLTIPAAHGAVSRAILEAGKHVYCEKPLTIDLEEGRGVLALAESKGLRVGCAPDTFLGAGQQTSRAIVDSGQLGRITSGTAFMLSPGVESWHPNPGFYYLKGGGPVLDMAPYYLTALVNCLGPVRSVCAMTSRARDERVASSEERRGERLPVEVDTHASGTLLFHSGAIITAVFSFDVLAADHSPIQLYGTEGSIKIPDPNTFAGPVATCTDRRSGWTEHALTRPYTEDFRGIGVADMARALLSGRPHRACGALAGHVLEVMHAFECASRGGRQIEIESHPPRPTALPEGLALGELD
jgi:predicted dehydrogenase